MTPCSEFLLQHFPGNRILTPLFESPHCFALEGILPRISLAPVDFCSPIRVKILLWKGIAGHRDPNTHQESLSASLSVPSVSRRRLATSAGLRSEGGMNSPLRTKRWWTQHFANWFCLLQNAFVLVGQPSALRAEISLCDSCEPQQRSLHTINFALSKQWF